MSPRRQWTLVAVLASATAFVSYGAGRTMDETVGFDGGATVHGVVFGALFLGITVLLAVCAGLVFRVLPRTAFAVTSLACGAAVACWALIDDMDATILALPIGVSALLAALLRRAELKTLAWSGVMVAGGLLAGSAASEAWILADESRFADEVALHPDMDHDRARAWPNRNAGLVYIAGEGTHATD